MKVMQSLLRKPSGDAGDGGAGKTAEQIAAEAAAAAGKTPEQIAAEQKTADEAAAAAAAAAGGKTPEQIAADEAAAAAAAKAAAKTGAPDKYELKLPEGATIQAADLKAIEDLARKNNLTNDEAQAALEEHNALLQTQSDAFKQLALTDKDYGGDKLAESQQLAQRVLDFIRPEGHPRRDAFMQFIHRAGASNHPEILGFLVDVGRSMGEDLPVASRQGVRGASDRKPTAEIMFDKSAKA